MTSIFEKKSLFYITCIPFFLFFLLFDIFLYPNKSIIQPSVATVQMIVGGSNGGAMEIVSKIISNWTSALYFVIAGEFFFVRLFVFLLFDTKVYTIKIYSYQYPYNFLSHNHQYIYFPLFFTFFPVELYSSVSVGILFWQFANDVVTVDEAKRFYPLFSQMGGLAPIVAGQYVARFASQAANFESSMHRLTVAIVFAGAMICTFYHLSTSFLEQNEEKDVGTSTATAAPKKKKSKMSMADSIKFLTASQYLRLVGMLVLGYGLSINFTEIMWKSLLKKKYPDPLDYQRFIGNFSSAVGFATCIVILFGVHVIRLLGWRVGAITTPTLMGVIAVPFFLCIFMGIDNPTRLSTAVALGTAQSLLSKTSKYALFDPTTQMAYIPLDEESKVKGKAAIDVLGSRLGKSGGSLIQQGLVFLFGNILSAAPAVSIIFYSVLITWLSAANKLSGLFLAKTEMQKAEKQAGK
jgi:AAA family ATP:ADP antiporter